MVIPKLHLSMNDSFNLSVIQSLHVKEAARAPRSTSPSSRGIKLRAPGRSNSRLFDTFTYAVRR